MLYPKKVLLGGILLTLCSVLNAQTGFAATQLTINSDLNIPTDTGGSDFSNNPGSTAGILVNTSNGGSNWIVNVSGDLLTSNNGQYGLMIAPNGRATFQGTGDNTLYIDNNHNAAETDGRGLYLSGNAVGIINDMNIDAQNNVHGIIIYNTNSNMTINGNGLNYINSSNNSKRGINTGGAKTVLNINGMDVTSNDNGQYGLLAETTSLMRIAGNVGGSNTLTANGNISVGIAATGFGTVHISDMDIFLSNNGAGMRTNDYVNSGSGVNYYGGNITIEGNSSYGNNLIIKDNINAAKTSGFGMQISGTNNAQTNITNMNVDITGSVNGIRVDPGALLNISGLSDGSQYLNVSSNYNGARTTGIGLYLNGTGKTTISNMDITTEDNMYGIRMINGAELTIQGSSNSNTLYARNNTNQAANEGYGIHVRFANSNLKITDMNIDVSGNAASGLSVLNNASAQITGQINGTNWLRANNNVINHGITVDQTGSLIIENMNMETSGNGRYGVVFDRGSTVNITGVADKNVWLIKDNGLFGMYVTAGTRIENMNIIASGNDLVTLGGTTTMDFINTDILVTTDNQGFVIGSSGTLNFTDASYNSAFGKFIYSNTGVGKANVNAVRSDLNGAVNIEAGQNIIVNLSDNSRWGIMNSSRVNSLNLNNSELDTRSSKTNNFNKLDVDTLSMNDGQIHMNSSLGGDLSGTDVIKASVSASGNAELFIHDVGNGRGAQTNEGIKVIDLTGVSTNTATGGVVDTRAYEYILEQGNETGSDTDSWYLKSTKKLSSISEAMMNVPALHLSIVRTGMNSLRRRMGDLRREFSDDTYGFWTRGYGKHLEVNEVVKSDMDIFGIEAGFDLKLLNTNTNTIYAGVMGGMIISDNLKTQQRNNQTGNGNASTPSAGLYATWVNTDGWYADFASRYYNSNINVQGYSPIGDEIEFDARRNFITFNAEVGRNFNFDLKNEISSIGIEPKLELAYAHSPERDFTTNTDFDLYYGTTNSLTGKAGVQATYSYFPGYDSIWDFFVELAYLHEFDGKTDIEYTGVGFTSDVSGGGIHATAGISVWLSNGFTVQGEFNYEKGNVYQGYGGQIQFRYNF